MAADDEPDLTFVAPERRKMVRARIDLLNRFLTLEKSTTADADRLAAEMGVATSTFYALARAWKVRRDPKDVHGARTTHRAQKHTILGDEDFLDRRLADFDHGTSVETATMLLEDLALRKGVRIRSRSALRRYVRNWRAEHTAPIERMGGLGVDHCVLGIPVRTGTVGIPTLPLATVLINLATGEPIAVRLSTGGPNPFGAADAIRCAIEKARIAAWSPDATSMHDIAIQADGAAAWRELFAILQANGVDRVGSSTVRVSTGRFLPTAVPFLLGFHVHTRMAHRVQSRRIAKVSRHDAPVTLQEAQVAVDERLAATGAQSMLRLPKETDPARLAIELRDFVSRQRSDVK